MAFTLAMLYCGLFLYTAEKKSISVLESGEALYTGYLTDFPEEKENSYLMNFRIEHRIGNKGDQRVKGSIVLYNKKSSFCSSYLPGDLMMVRCSPLEITSRGNPYEFDYRFYMESRGTRYYTLTDSSDMYSHTIPLHRKLIHRALIIRETIIDMFRERGIEGDRLALVAAITVGQKNLLDPDQKQNFIKAGIMHIMAVSGLHAVILSLFIFKLLFFMKGRLNIFRVLITLLILWAFAFVTGLTPSVLRATLMFSFLQAGNILKRPVNGINSVLASAFVLIMIRPSVIFDAGFLLSYSAVIYIICFYRDLYLKILFRQRLPDLIWQSAAVTVIAQAGTLPLTIMLFNRFPTWFILSNIVIVPLSSLVIITGCLVPLTFPVHFLSMFIARILDILTGLTELLTEKAASLPLSTIENIGITSIECIILTVTIFLFTQFALNRKSISVIYPLTALLCLVLADTLRDIQIRRSSELIVYNSIGYSATGVRTGKILNLYSDTIMNWQEVNRHASTLRLKVKTNVINEYPYKIRYGDKDILITKYLNKSLLINTLPEIVILRGESVISHDIQSVEVPEALIIGADVRQSYRLSRLVRIISSDSVHFVRKDGAYNCIL
jgi:competence protein ComEC